jgi:hypothetical protein
VPEQIREEMTFYPVATMEEVLGRALEPDQAEAGAGGSEAAA